MKFATVLTVVTVLSLGMAKKQSSVNSVSLSQSALHTNATTNATTSIDLLTQRTSGKSRVTETAKRGLTTSATTVQPTAGSHSENGLAPGDVFGLVTVSNDQNVNGETVVIYNDGTLGVKQPTSPGYLFEAVLLDDYQLLVTPEPLATVKLNAQNVYFLNTSLFNPTPIFASQDWTLRTRGGSTVVCPSWNSVLVFVPANEKAPCQDAVNVDLGIVPISVE